MIETILIYLNALCLGIAVFGFPLMFKSRVLFNTTEDMVVKEWALLTDRVVTRFLLTAILTLVAHLLSDLIVYSVSLKGLDEAGLATMNNVLVAIAYGVFVVGGYGAIKQWLNARKLIKNKKVEVSVRNNVPLGIILGLLAFSIYIIEMRRLMDWIGNLS